jgi:hypothetical protein
MSCSCKFCEFQPRSSRVLTAIESVSSAEIWLAGEQTLLADFALSDQELADLSTLLGVKVSQKDYVWEIAQRVSNK